MSEAVNTPERRLEPPAGDAAPEPPRDSPPSSEPQAAMPPECEHHWVSEHEPGHRFYWIRQCSQCHGVDWQDLDAQAEDFAARMVELYARPPRNKRCEGRAG